LAEQATGGVGGIVLTGGEDVDPASYGAAPHPATGVPHEARDAYEIALTRVARDRGIPLLAICRGAQVVNVAFGGTLVQDIATEHAGALEHEPKGARDERVHRVRVSPGSLLAETLGQSEIATNSSHHQSVARVADGFRVSARTDDGIVEGFEPTDSSWWMLAVQWHPEELFDTAEDWDRRLFRAFADAARRASFTTSSASALRHGPGA